MKKCPFCAETIQDAAIKCKHCGSLLDAAAARGDQFEEARELARQGKTISAIKLVREQTGWGLKEAKDFVESPAFGVPRSSNRSINGVGCLLVLLVLTGAAVWWLWIGRLPRPDGFGLWPFR